MSVEYETVEPVTSTMVIDDDKTIAELDVSVYISHTVNTELIVEVTSPEGTTVRLHDQSSVPKSGIQTRYDLERAPDGPGTMDDFVGESLAGTWTLSVQDMGSASSGNGYFYQWKLHATVDGAFDCEPATCTDPVPTQAPDLHVETAETELTLVDGAHTPPALTFFQVRGVNACNHEGP